MEKMLSQPGGREVGGCGGRGWGCYQGMKVEEAVLLVRMAYKTQRRGVVLGMS